MLGMYVNKSYRIRLLGYSSFVGWRWARCQDSEFGHNPYKNMDWGSLSQKISAWTRHKLSWKYQVKLERASGKDWLIPLEGSGFKAWEEALYLQSLGLLKDVGDLALSCCFGWLFIISGILWLNFCETRGLTSVIIPFQELLSPHYVNGCRCSVRVNSTLLSETWSSHTGVHFIRSYQK